MIFWFREGDGGSVDSVDGCGVRIGLSLGKNLSMRYFWTFVWEKR